MKKWLWLSLLAAGCSAPAPASAPVPKKTDCVYVIDAIGPEWRKIAEELTKGKSVEEQQRLFEAERYYQAALACFNRADFEKARSYAQFAVDGWPEHLAARKLLSDVGEIIIGGPARIAGIGEQDLRVAQVSVEQQQIEITNHILHGGRFLDAKMYPSAVREFENAEFKIRNMPYDVKSMNDLLPKVRELAARARSSSRD